MNSNRLPPRDLDVTVTGGTLAIIKPNRDGGLTADETCQAACEDGDTVTVLVVGPVRHVAPDAAEWLGRALHLARRIEFFGPVGVGAAFRRDVAKGVYAARHDAWEEIRRRRPPGVVP